MYCKVENCKYPFTHVTAGHRCGKCRSYGHGQIECKNAEKLCNISRYLTERVDNNCTVENCSHSDLHCTNGHYCRVCRNMYPGCTCVNSTTIKCPICRVDNKIVNEEKSIVYGLAETCKVCLDRAINFLLPDCHHLCLCRECAVELGSVGIVNNEFVERHEQHVHMDALSGEEYNTARNILQQRVGKYCIIPTGQGCCWYIRYSTEGHETFFMHCDSWGQYGEATSDVPLLETFINGYEEVRERD